MATNNSDDISDEQYRIEEGIPSIEEPFIQKYLNGRDALIQQEKTKRSDAIFRDNMSPMVTEACRVVSAIRFEEQQTLWNPAYEENLSDDPNAGTVYPGMMFTLAKDKMEKSKLWKIVRKMPKGALLHCHFGATGDAGEMLEAAFKTEGICIKAAGPLATEEQRRATGFNFQFVKKLTTSEDPASIWSQGYKADTWVPLAEAAAAFPQSGKAGFVDFFYSRTTITHAESTRHDMGLNAIWQKFTTTFGILAGLQWYEPLYRIFLRSTLRGLNEDGVRWVDLRSVFVQPFYREGAETPDEDMEGMLTIMQEEIEAFKKTPEGEGFWGARLIWTGLRILDTRRITEDMIECIRMKQLFPDLICGYDLVGQEDLGRPLQDLTPELFWFKKQCMQNGVDIPFFFHAGECLGDGDSTDENLFDAILLGTRRIGHGFSLYKHPLLVDMVKEKKILVESCPISNEVLRLTASILSHPLPALLARDVACSLCNDDPSVLGHGNTSGMSHDFWQALQGWENLGLEGLASLAENSVRWASYEDCNTKDWQAQIKEGADGKTVRAEHMQTWAKEFEKFCEWVVMEYGAEVDLKTLD